MIRFIFSLVMIIGLVGCVSGISQEQRQEYLDMARQYEIKAEQTQNEADRCWKTYQEVITGDYTHYWKQLATDNLRPNCERLDEQAAEYRDRANTYYKLASD